MIKAMILAPNYLYYLDFIKRFNLNRNEHRYILDHMQAAGIDRDTPLWIIEGFKRNTAYDAGFMRFMDARFHNHKFIKEGDIWNEDSSI